MSTKITLVVPEKDHSIQELKKFLIKESADLFIFPEGFLDSSNLDEALNIIAATHSFVITGFKDLNKNKQQKALVIDDGQIVGEYTKCILTKSEKQNGKNPGEKIYCVDTKFGRIGIPICYEIHFPEVARIMRKEEPVLLVNIIGTGMYHELQYMQWTTLARARAIENEVFVIGCSHYKGKLPLAYAYAPSGECIGEKKKEYGTLSFEIDLEKSRGREIGYWEDRNPRLFGKISE